MSSRGGAMPKDEKGGKIRVLVFELEGSNETLQESLRTVAGALGRTVQLIRPALQAQPALNETGESVTAVLAEEAEYVEAQQASVTVAERPKRNRINRTPEIVEIDLKGGTIAFEAFAGKKNPTSDRDRYLVIAAWLKEYHNLDPIGQDHAYTCYRAMKWTVPKDVGSTFRNGKRDGLYKPAGKGMYSINHIGLNEVEKMGGGA
jgi:hypothetical protein